MNEYLCAVQIIEVFYVRVQADNPQDAIAKAQWTPSLKIREHGSLKSTETDYAEVIDGPGIHAAAG